MRRTISLLLAAVTILLMLPFGMVSAEEHEAPVDIIRFNDGRYIEITMDGVAAFAFGTVTKSKNYTYYNANNVASWKITLTGTFTYTGTTSTCTASSCTVTIYNDSWYVVSKSATKSGNTASATVTMGLKILGVTISKDTYNITLICDKNGNVS